MDYRYLGRSGLQVSPLCLGAMMFGGETDEATSQRIIAKAADQGINFLDTADIYHAGRSEEIVGRAIAADRDRWVVATEFGFPASAAAGPNQQGQSRKWIYQSVEASLKRLATDYIDLLYFHRAIPGLQLEEGARHRRPDPPGQGALLRVIQFPWLAHRGGRAPCRSIGY